MDISRMHLFPIKSVHPTPAALLGPGAHEMIGVSAAQMGMTKVLLMTTGLRGTGMVDEVKGIIEKAGVSVEVFDKVESNPKDYNVMDAHVTYVDAGCDGFISLGGGSSHDCTKATRVVAAHDQQNQITQILQWIIHHVSCGGVGGQQADKVHRVWRFILALMPQLGEVTQAFL